MTPEELHLKMIRFESRVGNFDHMSVLDLPTETYTHEPIEVEPVELAKRGFVRYSRTSDGMVVDFVDPVSS